VSTHPGGEEAFRPSRASHRGPRGAWGVRFGRGGHPEDTPGPERSPDRPDGLVKLKDDPVRSLPAATAAALAESGVIYLVVRLLIGQATGAVNGILMWYPAFVAVFVGATALAVLFRRHRSLPMWLATGSAAAGAIQGRLWGVGGVGEMGICVIVALFVAGRVLSLGVYDWRNPIEASFAWGAVILLVEVLLGGAIGSGWRPLLAPITALFFVGSMASRAASVRLAAAPETGLEPVEGVESGRRMTFLLMLAFGGGVVLLILFGGSGGGLALLGRVVFPGLRFFVIALAWIMGELARPVIWLADKVHLDLSGLKELGTRLANGTGSTDPHHAHAIPPVAQRILGFLVIGGVITLLVLWIRWKEGSFEWESTRREEQIAVVTDSTHPKVKLPRRRPSLRRELPADTVRRWYAEALLVLEQRGLPRRGYLTPGEYIGDVAKAFPGCANGFHELTRAYEEVRYGSRTFGDDALRVLEPRRALVMDVLTRAERADQPEDGEGEEAAR